MSFSQLFDEVDRQPSPLVRRFEQLLSPQVNLEVMAQQAHALTRQYFGKTMRLFAPLYVSNECVNNCKYCGFSRDNPIRRVTLTLDQIELEARHLEAEGFRNVLLVAGEHPRFVAPRYLEESVRRLRRFIPAVSIEVGPMEAEDYRPIVEAGADGLIVYQETYDRALYDEMHTAGPKKNFDWRLDCLERGYEAGFRRLGIGALLGLGDWRVELSRLVMHAEYLLKTCWKSCLTISMPRLRPAAGEFQPRVHLTDREYTQALMALRICFPQVGLVLSTREPSWLRDGLMSVGVTMMSAGARTEPGGYTHVGEDDLHLTVRGKRVELTETKENCCSGTGATSQFNVSDERSTQEVVRALHAKGLDPVWKDWDYSLGVADPSEPVAV